jgi:hypothetical protein
MTLAVDAEAPAILFVSAGEARSRPGALWREVARSLVVVDDHRIPARNALLVPPYLIPRVLEALGIDPDVVPGPAEVADSLGPDEAA